MSAPPSWAITYQTALADSILPATQALMVTAGLKWPPEMWPKLDTMTASTRPWARATPRSEDAPAPAITTDPAPMNTRAIVPITSATTCSAIDLMRASLPLRTGLRPIPRRTEA